MDERPKSPMDGQSKHKVAYGWTDNQSRLRVDGLNKSRLWVDKQSKLPTGGRSKHKVTYGWTNDQSHLRVDGLNTKSSTGGHMTKVTYRWMV